MAGNTVDVEDGGMMPQTRSGIVLVGLSIGSAVGAVALGIVAFAIRVPDGYLSADTSRNTQLFVGSLALAVLTAAALTAVGIFALVGHEVMGWAALVPATSVAVAGYLYFNDAPLRRTGLSVTDALAVARASWLVLALAGLLLLAGAAACRATPAYVAMLRPAAVAAVVTGLVIASGAGYGGVLLSGIGQARATTAAAVAVPSVPTEVGEQVAYTMPVDPHPAIVPAGAGFVVHTRTAVVAYDGATGVERWRYPTELFPENCLASGLRSTGTAPDAVVVVECRRYPEPPTALTDQFRDDDSQSLLTAFDANTGVLLWRNDFDWTLQARRLLPPGALPVRRDDEFALLDPRTGAATWTRQFGAGARCENYRYVVALDRHLAYLAGCDGVREVLHLVERGSGDERTLRLPPAPSGATDGWYFQPVAADGDTLVIHGRTGSGLTPDTLLSVNASSGEVQPVPLPGRSFNGDDADRSLDYPGPVLQLAGASGAEATALYEVAARRLVRADGVRVGDTAVPENLRWAPVGDRLVTATTRDENDRATVTLVAPDGTSTIRPSPCDTDIGGVLPVPGAVLLLCARGADDGRPNGYDVLALR